jgi:hypothetical protein
LGEPAREQVLESVGEWQSSVKPIVGSVFRVSEILSLRSKSVCVPAHITGIVFPRSSPDHEPQLPEYEQMAREEKRGKRVWVCSLLKIPLYCQQPRPRRYSSCRSSRKVILAAAGTYSWLHAILENF